MSGSSKHDTRKEESGWRNLRWAPHSDGAFHIDHG